MGKAACVPGSAALGRGARRGASRCAAVWTPLRTPGLSQAAVATGTS